MIRYLLIALSVALSISSMGSASGQQFEYKLSSKATEVMKLIDKEEYQAADRVFSQWLNTDVNDVGLLCQYVRFLILSRDPGYPDFIQSPLIKGDGFYWAEGVARDALKIASGLDEECKPYLTNLVLEAFAKRLEISLEEKRGFIGKGRTLYNESTGKNKDYRGTQLSMIGVVFEAHLLSPKTGRKWIEPYTALLERFITLGKPGSSMMLGNLLGELIQDGDADGSEDFNQANKAFLASLENYKLDCRYDWLQDAADAYPLCFRLELLSVQNGKSRSKDFDKLVEQLEKYDVTIPKATDERMRDLEAPSGMGPTLR